MLFIILNHFPKVSRRTIQSLPQVNIGTNLSPNFAWLSMTYRCWRHPLDAILFRRFGEKCYQIRVLIKFWSGRLGFKSRRLDNRVSPSHISRKSRWLNTRSSPFFSRPPAVIENPVWDFKTIFRGSTYFHTFSYLTGFSCIRLAHVLTKYNEHASKCKRGLTGVGIFCNVVSLALQ